LLLLLSVLSYHPADSEAGLWGAGAETHVHNWVGPFGASVSELFVSILGITAFLLPVLLGVLVFGLLGRSDRSLVFWEGTSFLGVVTAVSVMAYLLFPALAFRGGTITGGGFLGEVVGSGLVAWISEPGTWVVTATTFLICSRVCFGVKYVRIARAGTGLVLRSCRAVLGGALVFVTSRARAMNAWRAEVLEDWRYERDVAREERQWQLEDRQAELADESRDRDVYEGDAARYTAEADLERGGTLAEGAANESSFSGAATWAGEELSRGGSRVQLPEEVEIEAALVEPSAEPAAEDAQVVEEAQPAEVQAEEEEPERVDSMIGAAARGVVHAELRVGKGSPTAADPGLQSDEAEGLSAQDDDASSQATGSEGSPESAISVDPTGASDGSSPEVLPSLPAQSSGQGGPRILSSVDKEEGAALVDRVVSMRRKIRLYNEPFEHPALGLLEMPPAERAAIDETELEAQAERLETTLRTFGVEGRVVNILPGPVITMFEFEPAPGTRVSKIANLGNDLALALKALRVRIVAPIPGKGAVGIEIPSANREMVYFREVLASKAFRKGKAQLPLAMGKGIDGSPVTSDLAKMPHMIVAGTTGSGKSVCVNTLILSLLYSRSPDEVRLVLVDPKILEFSIYEGIPHLLTPVVTSPKKAAMALKWAVEEMERRYQVLSAMNARNIVNYNEKADVLIDQWEAWEKTSKKASERPECGRQAGEDTVAYRSRGGDPVAAPDKMPYIVIIIDELADLMMVAKKDVEESIVRLAQKARASGIHMVLATQRPTVDVVTGLIKANFPSRLAFRVSQKNDSRVILDVNGAEALLGLGDGLFLPPGVSDLVRVHGAFVSDDEVLRVVDYLKTQGTADYIDLTVDEPEDDESGGRDPNEKVDAMYDECIGVVAKEGKASTSLLQRKLGLGYNRAARIMDMLEREGVIGPQNGAKPREVFVKPFEF